LQHTEYVRHANFSNYFLGQENTTVYSWWEKEKKWWYGPFDRGARYQPWAFVAFSNWAHDGAVIAS
jgi:hypothetical protein